jgi:hypothetical protein
VWSGSCSLGAGPGRIETEACVPGGGTRVKSSDALTWWLCCEHRATDDRRAGLLSRRMLVGHAAPLAYGLWGCAASFVVLEARVATCKATHLSTFVFTTHDRRSAIHVPLAYFDFFSDLTSTPSVLVLEDVYDKV